MFSISNNIYTRLRTNLSNDALPDLVYLRYYFLRKIEVDLIDERYLNTPSRRIPFFVLPKYSNSSVTIFEYLTNSKIFSGI